MKVLTIENGEKKLVEVATTGKILGEKFYSEFYTPISPSFPAICLSRLSDVDTKTDLYSNTNIPNLFTPLQSVKWKFNNSSSIAYSSYSIAAQAVVTLTAANNTLVNDPFLQAVREMIYYHNGLDRGAALVSQNYIDLNLVVLFKGVYCRVIGFNLTTRTITLDYSTVGQTTAAGNIEVYPYRLPATNIDYLTKIQIRKLQEETTLASGYNSGLNLENRLQGFKTQAPYNVASQTPGGFGLLADGANAHAWIAITSSIISDGSNGTVKTGKSTRSNQSQSIIYLWAEVYNA